MGLREAQEMQPPVPRGYMGGMDEMKMVKVTEILEIDDERDIDEDYDEEDDEVTEDDRREKAKIALVMVDLWEPSDDSSITESALRKLGALAAKERNRKLIRIAGAIPILVDILKEADPSIGLNPVQSLALSDLALLCRNVRNREEVRRFDGLIHVLRIARVRDEKDLLEDLKALKELAKNDRNKIMLREGRLIEFLVPKIDKENNPVQELVLDILTIMNMNEVKSQVVTRDAGGIPPIIKLLTHQNDDISRRAARCLGAVAQNNRKIQQIARKSKAINTVVKMLTHSNEEVRKSSAGAVAALAENDFSNQIAIRKCGAIPSLVKIISQEGNSDDTKEQACAAIRSLAKCNTKVQSDFKEGLGIPTLVKLMSSPHIGVKIHATGAIMELARDNSKN